MIHSLRSIFIIAALVGLFSSAFAQAPSTPFAVGVRQYNWTRDGRQITTHVYYPATGTPGGNPMSNAPVAAGVFPICEVTHGLGGSPSAMLTLIRPLAAAGFVVPAPVFTNASISDAYNGNLSRDVSQVLTNTIALNGAGTPFTGKINTAMVGVSGYSMGGMTTHGLLTAWPDSRIKAAIPIACVDMGNPSSTISAKVLFIHGDRDPTCPYSSARQAYSELPQTKAFLTFVGADHGSFWSNPIWPRTSVDWMRWSLYGDTAARDRLASGATSSQTRWELSDNGSAFPAPGTYSLRSRVSSGQVLDNMGRTSNGSNVGVYQDGSSANQRWVLSFVSSTVVKLQCVSSGLYLDGMGRTSDGSLVGTWSNSSSNNQRWTIISVGGGFYKLKNVATGLCLDVGASPWANGDSVEQWSDGASQNQHWQFIAP